MTVQFPLVEVAGPPRERGRQYGRQAGERIARGLEMYREEFDKVDVTWPNALRLAEEFSSRIRGYDADFMVEIEGIAEGAQQPVGAIVILNARTEIMYWNAARDGRLSAPEQMRREEGCSGVIVTPIASANAQPIHAQNWEWRDACVNTAVVLKIRATEGPDIMTFVEAGQLARNGMNSAGLALTANGLHCDQDYGRMGVPSPLIRRRILQQQFLMRAAEVVMSAERSFSHNLMLSDASGLAMNLETTPSDVFWLQPERGLLYHANHFKSPAALARVRDIGVRRGPDSLIRDQRLGLLLEPKVGQITVADVKAALADDVGHPFGVCRHPVFIEDDGYSSTVASVIMSTRERKMWAAAAPYAGAEFVEYCL